MTTTEFLLTFKHCDNGNGFTRQDYSIGCHKQLMSHPDPFLNAGEMTAHFPGSRSERAESNVSDCHLISAVKMQTVSSHWLQASRSERTLHDGCLHTKRCAMEYCSQSFSIFQFQSPEITQLVRNGKGVSLTCCHQYFGQSTCRCWTEDDMKSFFWICPYIGKNEKVPRERSILVSNSSCPRTSKSSVIINQFLERNATTRTY